jgi:hypothetical protein
MSFNGLLIGLGSGSNSKSTLPFCNLDNARDFALARAEGLRGAWHFPARYTPMLGNRNIARVPTTS